MNFGFFYLEKNYTKSTSLIADKGKFLIWPKIHEDYNSQLVSSKLISKNGQKFKKSTIFKIIFGGIVVIFSHHPNPTFLFLQLFYVSLKLVSTKCVMLRCAVTSTLFITSSQ